MTLHDVRNVFVAIAKNVRFHVSQKQTHVLLPPILNFLCCRIEIVILIDGVCTLVGVVIVNPTQIDLVLQVVFFCKVAMTIMAQTKDGIYHD
jgi:hypothetical protein